MNVIMRTNRFAIWWGLLVVASLSVGVADAGSGLGHAPHDGELVDVLGRFLEEFADLDSWNLSRNWSKRAAMFRRGVGLGVPGVHLRHSALLEDDEDAYCFAFATANRGVHRGSWEAKGTQTAGPQPQHIASVEVLGRPVGHVGLAIARGKAILAIAPAMLGSFKGGCDSLCLPLFSRACGL